MTRSSHRKKSKHVALLSALGVLLVLISFYTYRSTYYTKHFLPNTEINGINVSNLTVEKANEKLKEAYSDKNWLLKKMEKSGRKYQNPSSATKMISLRSFLRS